jgi:hypothetical protein
MHRKFIAMMPLWDFLDFLSGHAESHSTFDLRMSTDATDTTLTELSCRDISCTLKAELVYSIPKEGSCKTMLQQ